MDEYTQNAVLTATPEKLVEMLYDRAITLINGAIEGIDDLEKRNSLLVKAQEIVLYLNAVLDMKRGGEISRNLRALYDFIYRQLVDGNVNTDVEKLEVARDLLKELLETWKEVEKSAKIRPSVVPTGRLNFSA